MPKSRHRKKISPKGAQSKDNRQIIDDQEPAPRNRLQALAAAAIAVFIVLAMVLSAVWPFLGMR